MTSPIVGTFYRSPSPAAESFVRIGSQVEPATVVCIIEAMKLMNEIQAETSGEVVKDLRRERSGRRVRPAALWNQAGIAQVQSPGSKVQRDLTLDV